MIQFDAPWLFLLLPLPLLIWWLAPAFQEPNKAVRVPFLELLTRITGRQAGTGATIAVRGRFQTTQMIIAWLVLVTALARPVWMDDPQVRELPMRDLLVALDLSGSMDTRDFTDDTGQISDRLTAARQVLDDFLARREGDRVGLIFFGSAAFVQAPFTEDLNVVRELLDEAQVRMLGPRTVMGDAIGVAIQLFERSETDERVLIVLTDGNDTGSLVPPLRAAEIASDHGVTIYPVAMGNPEAAGEQALDEETLKNVAATTGGRYFHAGDRESLEAIYRELEGLNPRQVETISYRPQYELFFWPLGLAVILTLLFFGGAELRSFLAQRRVARQEVAL